MPEQIVLVPEQLINLKYIVAALVYSALGIVILVAGFWVFDRLTPGHLWQEIVEEQNTALAIVAGAMAIAMAMIISASLHG
ncbi:MAG: DUF350 domain-containing protein [Bdellovibrionaceae bacterium]|nr:DUF350 domain-containing protein [Pseudobdellovibrionaceae bacterium]